MEQVSNFPFLLGGIKSSGLVSKPDNNSPGLARFQIANSQNILTLLPVPSAIVPRNVFITGGSGYLGRFLIPQLLHRGHYITALVRNDSEKKLPAGCKPVAGDALKQLTFKDRIKPADTFVQLVGVPHPSPAKAAQFR